MKLSKSLTSILGCLWLSISAALLIVQIVFLTIKLAGIVAWSWWATLLPIFCVFGLPVAVFFIAVVILTPKMLIAEIKRSRRVDAEAKKYGMQRKPGESTEELKKRLIRRNMIAGNYSRKDIKDAILRVFPNVGSCQILVNNQKNEIVIIPRRAESVNGSTRFMKPELRKIAVFAAQYIPDKYKLTVQNAEEKDGEENHNKAGS